MKKILIFVLLISSFAVKSQEIIQGKVTDCETGEPLPEAIVYIPYLHKGVVSDENGDFKCIDVQHGEFDLTVSLLGYQTEIITINTEDISDSLVICLREQMFETQEVIISGSRHSLQHENAVDIQSVKFDNSSVPETNFLRYLSKQAGVDMITKGNGLQKPVIRGLSNTNILIVDNGIRKENYQFSENHPFLIDDNGTERIEIIKGPASLLYGSDAVGGVIFLVPEKPAVQNSIGGNVMTKYSVNDNGLAAKFGLKGAGTSFHSGLNVGIKSYADYYDAEKDQVPNSRFNTVSIKANGGLSYKFGKTDIYGDYIKMKVGMVVPAAVPLIVKNSRFNDIWFQDLDSKILSLKNKFFIHRLMIDADLSYQANRRKLFTVAEEHDEEDIDESDEAHDHHDVDMNLTTYSYNFKGTYSISNTLQIMPGFQGMSQLNKNFETTGHVIPDALMNDISVFTILNGNYFDKLHFSTGVRFDHRHIITDEEENRPKVDRNYDNFSYSAGLTWQVTYKFLVRSNFASAHRTPNIAELTQNGAHGAVFELGNPDLKSQINFEPDLSFHYHGDHILFEAAGYYNFISDYIWLGNTGLLSAENLPVYQYNQTDAEIMGFETGLKLMILESLKVYGNYSFIDAKQTDGSYLPFIPQNKIHSELTFKPKKKISGFCLNTVLESVYAFKQDHLSEFETETNSYFVLNWDLSFERKINDNNIIIAMKINNILNEQYIDHLSTLKVLGYFSQGRNISFSIKYSF